MKLPDQLILLPVLLSTFPLPHSHSLLVSISLPFILAFILAAQLYLSISLVPTKWWARSPSRSRPQNVGTRGEHFEAEVGIKVIVFVGDIAFAAVPRLVLVRDGERRSLGKRRGNELEAS